eukprot:TRINITY_DN10565_c0_g1_i1.p1 TRINITY_DN10565_c0_g1~~TRINITY_DN10565_c0_g1_i1.p1  ORF type:complete len:1067 (+),score=186.17 TRINITY_DN10565_c0_g1_i1:98-3202(+)
MRQGGNTEPGISATPTPPTADAAEARPDDVVPRFPAANQKRGARIRRGASYRGETWKSLEEEDGYGFLIGVVETLDRGVVKAAMLTCWFAVICAGLYEAMPFMQRRVFSFPPPPGSSSHDALMTFQHYFPAAPVEAALFIESTSGRPMLDFQNESTCSLAYNMSYEGGGVKLKLACENATALGGGCITKASLIRESVALTKDLLSTFVDAATLGGILSDQLLPMLEARMPDVKSCPVPVAGADGAQLTRDLLGLPVAVLKALNLQQPSCRHEVLSFLTVPEQNIVAGLQVPISGVNVSVDLAGVVPAGTFWGLVRPLLANATVTSSLLNAKMLACQGEGQKDPYSRRAGDFAHILQQAASAAPASLRVRTISLWTGIEAIHRGVEQTMWISSLTVPLALLIVAYMVGSIRLVLCTVVTLTGCMASAFFIMQCVVWLEIMEVALFVPAIMMAVILAMSIDYSLFLLTRFNEEVTDGLPVRAAVVVMLGTSGRIVLLSGLTLLLCFTSLLIFPGDLVSSMGVGAAVAVLTALFAGLTLTPTVILTFPEFFAGAAGKPTDAAARCPPQLEPPVTAAPRRSSTLPQLAAPPPLGAPRTPSAAVEAGAGVTGDGAGVTGDSAGSASANDGVGDTSGSASRVAPPRDVSRTLPRTHSELRRAMSCWVRCGAWTLRLSWPILILLILMAIPLGIFVLPEIEYSAGLLPAMPAHEAATRALVDMGRDFGSQAVFPTQILLVPPENSTVDEAARSRWLARSCAALREVAAAVDFSAEDRNLPPFTAEAFVGRMMLSGSCIDNADLGEMSPWSHVGSPYSATQVHISYQLDPFSAEGRAWIQRLRRAVDAHPEVGRWYVYGEAACAVDILSVTYSRLPEMVLLMIGVVLVLMFAYSRSVVSPLRALACLTWMLVISIAMAVLVFPSGGIFWTIPVISLPVLIGLGLDYDIFYTERVVENRQRGLSPSDAALHALAATANTISAAGTIMVIAFLPLVLCDTPMLRQIGIILTLGVCIDCFVSTKVVVPCAIHLLGRFSFWPRRFR